MSERNRFGALTLALPLSLLAWRAPSAQTIDEYTRRSDSLVRIWRAATKDLVTRDSADRALSSHDTLRVGNFVVVTDSANEARARAAAERVSPELDRWYGAFAAQLRSRVFVLRSRPSPRANEAAIIQSGFLDERGELRFASQEWPRPDDIAASWRVKAAEVITRDLPAGIYGWMGQSIPAESLTTKQLNADRIDLILTGSQAAHDCALGSTDRCVQALGLRPVDEPAFALFNERERFGMVEHNNVRFRRADALRYSRCADQHVQATCDSLVREIPPDAIPTATPPSVRRSLVRFALRLGGPGSFDRLAAPGTGTISDRIASAANAPIDSVVRSWQQTLMNSQRNSTAMNFATAASAAFWAVACCALALRSSRWR